MACNSSATIFKNVLPVHCKMYLEGKLSYVLLLAEEGMKNRKYILMSYTYFSGCRICRRGQSLTICIITYFAR